MFKSEDLDFIDSQIEKFTQRFLLERTENLRQLVLDSPTQFSRIVLDYDPTRLILKVRKVSEKITMAIVSWYLPEEIRFLIQLELSENWGGESKEVKEVLLTSKDYALTWLMKISDWNESDFFGNYLNKSFVRLFNLTDFRKISKVKVERYSGYCRGYQDTNRGVPSSLSREHWAKLSVQEEMINQLQFEQMVHQLFQRVSEELLYLQTGIRLEWLV